VSAASSAVHRALAANPEATSKVVSAGLKHGVPKSSPYSAAVSVGLLVFLYIIIIMFPEKKKGVQPGGHECCWESSGGFVGVLGA